MLAIYIQLKYSNDKCVISHVMKEVRMCTCLFSELGPVLEEAYRLEATDIHLEEHQPVYARDASGLHELSYKADTSMIDELLQLCHILSRECWCSVDEAFSYKGTRIRAHLYKSNDAVCGTLRILSHKELVLGDTEDDLLLKSFCQYRDGLILTCGPTGSGKSYTMASCLEFINQTMAKHIVTLEDPIEFQFTNQKGLIHQRQLGIHINSMAEGIRDALREDPDVIMVGELRDKETLEAALHAAETGHLVFATMHTQRSVLAINRIISMFSAEQQDEIRSQLSQVLRVVLCQRLFRLEHKFLVPKDILINTRAVANLIRSKKEAQIISIQETQPPMQTLEMAVNKLALRYGQVDLFKELL